jgi:hypothetical protein
MLVLRLLNVLLVLLNLKDARLELTTQPSELHIVQIVPLDLSVPAT